MFAFSARQHLPIARYLRSGSNIYFIDQVRVERQQPDLGRWQGRVLPFTGVLHATACNLIASSREQTCPGRSYARAACMRRSSAAQYQREKKESRVSSPAHPRRLVLMTMRTGSGPLLNKTLCMEVGNPRLQNAIKHPCRFKKFQDSTVSQFARAQKGLRAC